MDAEDVLTIYTQAETLGIRPWIDGGWAVDALLGKQTRPHQDLDLAIQRKDLAKFKSLLQSQGYQEIPRDENKKWDSVWRDGLGHEVELHPFEFDIHNKVIEEEYWDGYTANSLTGMGFINEQPVRCVSLEQVFKTHNATKRELQEKDNQDLRALYEKFGKLF